MNGIKTIRSIVESTIDKMNSDKTYRRIYPYTKAGTLHKLVEIEILDHVQELYPHLNLYHPADNSGKPDIYTDVYHTGVEVKATFGWEYIHRGKPRCQIRWTNGTVQNSTENFLFIKLGFKNDKLVAENIWFGNFSYDKWTIHWNNGSPHGMRISDKIVKKLCKQIK